MNTQSELKNLIGSEKYFIHKGTWGNDYEWRIQKVTITGLKIDKDCKWFCEFGLGSCGYEYPVEYLDDSFEEAKTHAIKLIKKEYDRLIKTIKNSVL